MKLKKYKLTLSVISITLIALAFVLVPKTNKEVSRLAGTYQRYVPPPSPTATTEIAPLLSTSAQPPASVVVVDEADFTEGGYISIFEKNEEVVRSDILTGVQTGIIFDLPKETKDGDVLDAVLYNEQGKEKAREQIYIFVSAAKPGLILPQHLL